MKPASRIILLTIFLAMVTVACVRTREQKLLEVAETVMEDRPDSALAILADSIAMPDLKTKKDSARYALLLTQAMVKTDTPVTSDSLIKMAFSYFSKSGSKTDKMKSSFYLSQILFNNHDYPSAIVKAMQARDLAISLDSVYWQAKAAELQSFIFNATYKNDDAIKYSKEAAEYYRKSGHHINHLFSLMDMATNYGNEGNLKRCLEIIDSIRHIQSIDTIPGLLEYTLQMAVDFNLRQKNYTKASELIDSLFMLGDKTLLNSDDYLNMSRICLNNGDYNGCLTNLQFAEYMASTIPEKAGVLLVSAAMYNQQGLYKEALAATNSVLKYQNDQTQITLKESTVIAQRDYNDSIAIENKNFANKLQTWMFVGIIFVLIAIPAFYYWHKTRFKIEKLELDKKINYIYNLTNELHDKDILFKNTTALLLDKEAEITQLKDNISRQSEIITSLSEKVIGNSDKNEQYISELSKLIEIQKEDISGLKNSLLSESTNNTVLKTTVENLFRQQWSTLNALCGEYLDMDEASENTRLIVVKNIEKHLNKLRNENNIRQIRDAVNLYMDYILDKLQEQCPFISDSDITFLGLIYAGFSPKAVALFTGCKLKYYYNKKKRLSDRIEKSGAPDKDFFLQKL